MRSWNSQEVFATDDFHFERREADYQTHTFKLRPPRRFAGSSRRSAHAHQRLANPALYGSQGTDDRFSNLAKDLSFLHPQSRSIVIEEAGHRAPWSKPAAFKRLLVDFINEIDYPHGERKKGEARR